MNLGIIECSGCKGNLYNNKASSSFKWVPNSTKTIAYFDGTVYSGQRCLEKVCPI